jgi:hypothetical protein
MSSEARQGMPDVDELLDVINQLLQFFSRARRSKSAANARLSIVPPCF